MATENAQVQLQLARLIIAAQPTPLEQLRHVPKDTWINLALCIVAVVVVVRMWRMLRSWNDYAPYMAAVLAGSAIFFYWVYERTEPEFMTPIVAPLAHFLPSRDVQQERIEKVRKSRRD